jgi:hypothetical protein
MTHEDLNAPSTETEYLPRDLTEVPAIDIAFYPGFDEPGIYQARIRAQSTIWDAPLIKNSFTEEDQEEAVRRLTFAKSQHALGIKFRSNGNQERAYDHFMRSESIARRYYDLNLLSESLAHQVDMFIILSKSNVGIVRDGYRIKAMQSAVEAMTYAEYLQRNDLNWFGWKVFEAACETGNWKYAAHYWVFTTGLENAVVKSAPKTVEYGLKKVKKVLRF